MASRAGELSPLSRGFDEYYGVLGGGSQYVEESGEEVAYALNGEPGPRSTTMRFTVGVKKLPRRNA